MTAFDRMVAGIIAGLIATIGGLTLLGDQAGAGIASFEPGDGSNPSPATSIRIAFDQPMNQASVQTRFSIQPAIDGAVGWDNNTFVFKPRGLLSPHTTYTITLAAGATTKYGRIVKNNLSWSFQPRQPDQLYLSPANATPRGLWIVDASGAGPHPIYAPPQGVDSFSPSPDGSWIAVTVNGDQQAADLWLIHRDGSNPRQITHCAPSFCGRPAWSPDGRMIAYERRDSTLQGEGTSARLWLYDVTNDTSAPLFQDEHQTGFDIVWSPDSARLAFFDPDRAAIRIVEVATGSVTVIPSQMGQTGVFSPDGLSMVFTDIRPVGGQFFAELWLGKLNADQALSPLFENAEEDQFPAWSPDGQWIAFGRRYLDRRDGLGTQLMLYGVSSGEVRQMTNDKDYNNTAFRWSPDGSALLIERFKLGTSEGVPELWLYSLPTGKLALLASDALEGRWLP